MAHRDIPTVVEIANETIRYVSDIAVKELTVSWSTEYVRAMFWSLVQTAALNHPSGCQLLDPTIVCRESYPYSPAC